MTILGGRCLIYTFRAWEKQLDSSVLLFLLFGRIAMFVNIFKNSKDLQGIDPCDFKLNMSKLTH